MKARPGPRYVACSSGSKHPRAVAIRSRSQGRIQQSCQDHCAIVSAIIRGDGHAADRAMHDHLTTGGRVFADLVAEAARYANKPEPCA
ncbi:FCD domain-containing protein [Bradyrhizobium valentinum]|uniref:FCD domain-containing protein n=1 Tax=Bradyrhizobium valentinum TaxID=1518501 RepID=UPI0009EA4311|nr:FCD domain-containing protein [Bradyrhizobium valentinum]